MKYNFKINPQGTIKERLQIENLEAEVSQKLLTDLSNIALNEVEFVSIDEWIKNHSLSNDDANDFIEEIEDCLEGWTFKTVYYENCEISETDFQIYDETWFLIKKGKTQFFAISYDYHDILDLKVQKIKE